jgi:hypothetical protein
MLFNKKASQRRTFCINFINLSVPVPKKPETFENPKEIETFSEEEKSSKIDIKIIGQSDAACQNLKTKFEKILNEFIKKDEISNETVELLTRDQVNFIFFTIKFFRFRYYLKSFSSHLK